jgi:hypothetical protein
VAAAGSSNLLVVVPLPARAGPAARTSLSSFSAEFLLMMQETGFDARAVMGMAEID